MPATLVAGLLVASVIPGLLLVLLLGPLSEGIAAFIGGGTDLLLAALVQVVAWSAQPEWAAVAVSRGWVLVGGFGWAVAAFMGDAPRAVEEALAADGGPVDVLKVGHHGSETSSSSTFLTQARPAVALISVGRGNRFGYPHRSALGRLEAAGARVHRTDREEVLAVRARRDGTWTLTSERAPD